MPTLTVRDREGETHRLGVEAGAVLREALLEAGLSPYTGLTARANCGGRGLCATCGVWAEPAPAPTHWHDRLAADWGYPRLSCQIRVEADLAVEIPPKVVWGKRRPASARR
ncbi:MAG: 2Fe-2S iron-sulfur cluster-binding protein [Bacteroidota bacterium]